MVACGACVPACPADAITITPGPNWAVFGDAHTTNAIIASVWHMAEHGADSDEDPVGAGTSGQGFDQLKVVMPAGQPPLLPEAIDLRVSLHHRGRAVWLDLPVIGEVDADDDETITLARAAAAETLGTLAAVPGAALTPALLPYADLLMARVTAGGDYSPKALAGARAIAIRPPLTGMHALEDLARAVDWLRLVNPAALVVVEVAASPGAAWAAAGAAHAGAHAIYLYDDALNAGGIMAGCVRAVHRHLEAERVRDPVSLIAGGMRTPVDVLKAVALGADAGAVGVVERIALGGVPDGRGRLDPGAPIDPAWGARQLVNLYLAWEAEFRRALALLSVPGIRALRGRDDLLAVVEAAHE
jgi:ferredoxin